MTTVANTTAICPSRCHDRGLCFISLTEPDFGPVCACDELWEGSSCAKRQHNPWHPCVDVRTPRAADKRPR